MNKSKSNEASSRPFTTLRPSQPPLDKEADSPYPWTDVEMISRYGMRYSTLEEKKQFPTHRLVLNVFKVRIMKIGKSPYINPEAGIGWVVWTVESYPGLHQFRMLNGDLLHEQYHQIEWERVPDEMPITTLASAKRVQVKQQWQRQVRSGIQQSLRL